MMTPSSIALAAALICSPLEAQSPGGGNQPAASAAIVSAEQIRDYAGALVAIGQARATAKAEIAAMPDAPSGILSDRMRQQVSEILRRFDLDRPTFNRITARVDADPVLAQRVQRSVMAAQVGT